MSAVAGWSVQHKSRLIELRDAVTASYVGAARDERDVAVVRSAQSVSSATGVAYYELDLVHVGESARFAFGLALSDVALSRMPGAERTAWAVRTVLAEDDDDDVDADDNDDNDRHPNGTAWWSLHHYDNRANNAALTLPRVRLPVLHDGDSVGCVASFVEQRLYFTLNGRLVDAAVFHLAVDAAKHAPLFAVLGMHSRGAVAVARFAPPFRFDIGAFAARLRQRVVAERIDCLADPAPQLVASLVADQLAWSGFADVLAAAQQQLLPGVPPLPDARAASGALLAERQALRRAILAGQFDEPLALLTASNAPPALRFDVACAAVAQAVMQGATPAVVSDLAQRHLQPLVLLEPPGSSERVRRTVLLERTVGLLAFPPGAPRQRVAEELALLLPPRSLASRANSALLPQSESDDATSVDENPLIVIAQALLPGGDDSARPMSALERVLRHRDALLAMLAASGSAEAALLLNSI
jgi:hypothetical protein